MMKKALLVIFVLLSALLFSAPSIAAQTQSIGNKPGGGSGSGSRPLSPVPCHRKNPKECIPKPPKKCTTPFQGDCP